MAKKKTNYTVTIGYKAVIEVRVKADSEAEAKKLATADFDDKFRLPGATNIDINDDKFAVQGIINMDETWNMVQS